MGFAGKEGGGFGLGPVFVAGAVEGGEGIAAGSAGLVIEPGGFVAGRNDHAERSTVTRARDARHATVAGLVDGGEGQGVGDKAGERAGQGMGEVEPIGCAPRGLRQRDVIGGESRDDAVDGGEAEGIPIEMGWRKQMGGFVAMQRPKRRFVTKFVIRKIRVGGEDFSEDGAQG